MTFYLRCQTKYVPCSLATRLRCQSRRPWRELRMAKLRPDNHWLRDFLAMRPRPFGLHKAIAWGLFLLIAGVAVGVGFGTGQTHRTFTPSNRNVTTPSSRPPTNTTTTSTAPNSTYRPLEPGGPVSVSHLLAISFVDDRARIRGCARVQGVWPDGACYVGRWWRLVGRPRRFARRSRATPSILFTSDTQGILWANGAQFIEHTSDGGRTWSRIDLVGTAVSAARSGETIMLVDASACSPTGFTSTSPCATWIAWSSDGGNNWRQAPIGDSEHESYGHGGEVGTLGDPSDAYVIAGEHLYVTTDAGGTWVARSSALSLSGRLPELRRPVCD